MKKLKNSLITIILLILSFSAVGTYSKASTIETQITASSLSGNYYKASVGIKNAGFDMVSLANNHSMDYKREGLFDTMMALKKYQLPYVKREKGYLSCFFKSSP